jgi:3-oxoacyl-[acyl-carrier-protein] synthase-3
VSLHLHGLGHFHPEIEISNRFLEELDIGTTDEWIVERVGIRSRRTVLPLDYLRATRNRDLRAAVEAAVHSNADLARRAAELALARSGLEPSEIGWVVSGSSAPDPLSPAEACLVADELGISAPAFDLNSACTTFLAQLHLLSLMQPERLPRFVLVVAVDSLTKVTDYSDRSNAVLFGDGAAAAVVSTAEPGRAEVMETDLRSDPSGASKVTIPRHAFFTQQGRAVQMFAIKKTSEGLAALQSAAGEEPGRSFHFVGHQANQRVLEASCERCGIAPERHHANVEYRGNTGSPGAPSVVSEAWEKWCPGDDVALVSVGSGLSWARALLRFGDTP